MTNESIQQKIARIRLLSDDLRKLHNYAKTLIVSSPEFREQAIIIRTKTAEIKQAQKELYDMQQIGHVQPIPKLFWYLLAGVIVTWALFIYLLLQKSHP